ncbi:MAG: hypothetical protein WBN23_12485 [Woeseia sp.]
MKKILSIALAAVGLLNLFPIIGVLSAEHITGLYGIAIESADLEILMRHRAVMLGLIGGFLLLSAFRPSLQMLAASLGLVSMSSFVVLAYIAGDNGDQIHRVVVADIVGSVAAAFVLVVIVWEGRNAA